jgi:sugar lactone lactonase YvrE
VLFSEPSPMPEERMTELTVVAEKYSFLEGPRWHEGRLWLSDFYTHQVVSLDESGADVQVEAQVPAQPSGLGWLPDGRLLIVSMGDHTILRREADGRLAVHADLSEHATGVLNDMVVDADGRAYVGNFGFDLMGGAAMAPAPLVRVDPDGTTTVVSEPLHFANGAVIHDGTLVVAETFGHRMSAFDISAGGELSARRDWASFGPLPGTTDVTEALGLLSLAPDGICLDAEGAVWAADALGNRAVRVREGGEIVDEISTGETGVYALALGGSDGRTLYLCTAPGFAEHERRHTREAKLLAARVDVPAA